MAALVFVAVLFNINAVASDDVMSSDRYEAVMELKNQFERDYLRLLEQYENDVITYEEFKTQADEITERYQSLPSNLDDNGFLIPIAENISNKVTKITEAVSDSVSKYGDTVKDWLTDVFADNTVYEEVSTTDKLGYKTLLIAKQKKSSGGLTGHERYYYTNGYIVLHPEENKLLLVYDGFEYCTKQYSYGALTVDVSGIGSNNDYYSYDNWELTVFGDVRYEDGSEAPTDDTTSTIKKLDLDNMSDKDIDELIDDVLDELKMNNPDLSNIEGLLEAIYHRLGSLDSDDDNELLSQVLVAIQSLEMNGDNSELIDILNDIKDSLTDGKDNTEDENEDLTDELEKHLTVGDFVIDEDMYRNHSEILKLRLQEKFIFAEQLKELVTYAVSSYASSDETPNIEIKHDGWFYSMNFDIYEEYMPTIRFMIAGFTYIAFALRTYRKIPSYINGGDNL